MADAEDSIFGEGTLKFLEKLKSNNNREWFHANKSEYEANVKHPAAAFAHAMEFELENLTGIPHKSKIFRINRDIRFSKDKTPYNVHIHISWSRTDMKSGPAWMFGSSLEYCTLGCGMFEFSKPGLESYRNAVCGSKGDDLTQVMKGLSASDYRLADPALKRIPTGYPDAGSNAELLRYKGFMAWFDLDGPRAVLDPDLIKTSVRRCKPMLPLWKFLSDLE
ncbi:MAG: DUF2461 domain-containing protein [Rhizobiaceae bacterium]